jgi:hypothetical protein
LLSDAAYGPPEAYHAILREDVGVVVKSVPFEQAGKRHTVLLCHGEQ